jgi:tRNA(His) 5'-end guanylyltransferase
MSAKSLPERMQDYENIMDHSLTPGIPFIVRLDGKNFSNRIKKWKCLKPFDTHFHEIMNDTAMQLFKEIADVKLVWFGSDEISLLILEKDTDNPWYGKRINKILSLTASIATATFNLSAKKYNKLNRDYFNMELYPAYFDSRIIQIPNITEGFNNFIWRQRDCIRNSISGWSEYFYSAKELIGKNSDEKIEMLKNKDFDFYKDAQNWSIYGTLLFKVNSIFDLINKNKITTLFTESDLIKNKCYLNSEQFFVRKTYESISEQLTVETLYDYFNCNELGTK